MDTIRLKKVLQHKESDIKKRLHALTLSYHDIELSQIEFKALEKVHEAINRIDMGDYGICASCDAEIAENRLECLPDADYCDECHIDLDS